MRDEHGQPSLQRDAIRGHVGSPSGLKWLRGSMGITNNITSTMNITITTTILN